jgi:hypothetical protein
MGETAAQTLNEIEATRTKLGGELEELEARLPAAVAVAKRAGAAVAGVGMLGVVGRFVVRRRKRSKADDRYRELEHRISRHERRID